MVVEPARGINKISFQSDSSLDCHCKSSCLWIWWRIDFLENKIMLFFPFLVGHGFDKFWILRRNFHSYVQEQNKWNETTARHFEINSATEQNPTYSRVVLRSLPQQIPSANPKRTRAVPSLALRITAAAATAHFSHSSSVHKNAPLNGFQKLIVCTYGNNKIVIASPM